MKHTLINRIWRSVPAVALMLIMGYSFVYVCRAQTTQEWNLPSQAYYVYGQVNITGTVNSTGDEYQLVADSENSDRVIIAEGNATIINGTLATWNTTAVADGLYDLSILKKGDGTREGSTSVFVDNVDSPPEFDEIGDRTAKPEEELSFTVHAASNDVRPDKPEWRGNITYSATGLPPGATFTSTTQGAESYTFSWTPHLSDKLKSVYKVAFKATESSGKEATATVNIYPYTPLAYVKDETLQEGLFPRIHNNRIVYYKKNQGIFVVTLGSNDPVQIVSIPTGYVMDMDFYYPYVVWSINGGIYAYSLQTNSQITLEEAPEHYWMEPSAYGPRIWKDKVVYSKGDGRVTSLQSAHATGIDMDVYEYDLGKPRGDRNPDRISNDNLSSDDFTQAHAGIFGSNIAWETSRVTGKDIVFNKEEILWSKSGVDYYDQYFLQDVYKDKVLVLRESTGVQEVREANIPASRADLSLGLYVVGEFDCSKPTLVFIHGWMSSPGAFWLFYNYNALNGRPYNIVIFEYRSKEYFADARNMFLNQYQQFLASTGISKESVTFVAHSFGGVILMSAVLDPASQDTFNGSHAYFLAPGLFGTTTLQTESVSPLSKYSVFTEVFNPRGPFMQGIWDSNGDGSFDSGTFDALEAKFAPGGVRVFFINTDWKVVPGVRPLGIVPWFPAPYLLTWPQATTDYFNAIFQQKSNVFVLQEKQVHRDDPDGSHGGARTDPNIISLIFGNNATFDTVNHGAALAVEPFVTTGTCSATGMPTYKNGIGVWQKARIFRGVRPAAITGFKYLSDDNDRYRYAGAMHKVWAVWCESADEDSPGEIWLYNDEQDVRIKLEGYEAMQDPLLGDADADFLSSLINPDIFNPGEDYRFGIFGKQVDIYETELVWVDSAGSIHHTTVLPPDQINLRYLESRKEGGYLILSSLKDVGGVQHFPVQNMAHTQQITFKLQPDTPGTPGPQSSVTPLDIPALFTASEYDDSAGVYTLAHNALSEDEPIDGGEPLRYGVGEIENEQGSCIAPVTGELFYERPVAGTSEVISTSLGNVKFLEHCITPLKIVSRTWQEPGELQIGVESLDPDAYVEYQMTAADADPMLSENYVNTAHSNPGQAYFSIYGFELGKRYGIRLRAVRGSERSGFTDPIVVVAGAPERPTNLTVTSVSESNVRISWQHDGAYTDGYNVERRAGSGAEWTEVASGVAATTYLDTAVSSNSGYTYRVSAYHLVPEKIFSEPSNEASAFTLTSALLPAPANLRVTGQSSQSFCDSDDWCAKMAWDLDPAYMTIFEEAYVWHWDPFTGEVLGVYDFSGYNGVPAGTSNALSSCISPCSRYYYRARAYDGNNFSDYSNEIPVSRYSDGSCICKARDAQFKLTSVVGRDFIEVKEVREYEGHSCMRDEWYKVYRKGSGESDYTEVYSGSGQPGIVQTSLPQGKCYYYKFVKCCDVAGKSREAQEYACTIGTPLPPSGLKATLVTPERVTLSWDPTASDLCFGYRIERCDANGNNCQDLGTSSGTTFTDSNVTSGTSYQYRVYAFNNEGDSSPVSINVIVPAGVLLPLSVTPASGSSLVFAPQTFTATYYHAQGPASLNDLQIKVEQANNGLQYVTARYVGSATSGTFYLIYNNGFTRTTGSAAKGTTTPIDSFYAQLIPNGTVVDNPVNKTRTVQFNLIFKDAFLGNKKVSLYAKDTGNVESSWVQKGAWFVNAPPAIGSVSVAPDPGDPAVTVVTATYNDLNGGTDILNADLLLNTSTSTAITNCFYGRVTRNADNTYTFTLYDDSGTAPAANNMNSSAVVRSDSAATVSLRTLTVRWKVVFSDAFKGIKNAYLGAQDAQNVSVALTKVGGIVRIGTETNLKPSTGSVLANPQLAYSVVDVAKPLAVTSIDRDGWENITEVDVQFIDKGTAPLKYVWIRYLKTAGVWQPSLKYFDGVTTSAWLSPTLNIIDTPLAKLNCASSSVAGNSAVDLQLLTTTLDLTFKSNFAGSKDVKSYVKDQQLNSGWQDIGDWYVNYTPAVASAILPVLIPSKPNIVYTNNEAVITTTYVDFNGADDITEAWLKITSSVDATKYVLLRYVRDPEETFALSINGTSWSTDTSYAELNAANTTATRTLNTLTVRWAITFRNEFLLDNAPTTYTPALFTRDTYQRSGWSQVGNAGGWKIELATPNVPPVILSEYQEVAGPVLQNHELRVFFDDDNGMADIAEMQCTFVKEGTGENFVLKRIGNSSSLSEAFISVNGSAWIDLLTYNRAHVAEANYGITNISGSDTFWAAFVLSIRSVVYKGVYHVYFKVTDRFNASVEKEIYKLMLQ